LNNEPPDRYCIVNFSKPWFVAQGAKRLFFA
jgi:hypothetical protein